MMVGAAGCVAVMNAAASGADASDDAPASFIA
jgi:hypothetical protein